MNSPIWDDGTLSLSFPPLSLTDMANSLTGNPDAAIAFETASQSSPAKTCTVSRIIGLSGTPPPKCFIYGNSLGEIL